MQRCSIRYAYRYSEIYCTAECYAARGLLQLLYIAANRLINAQPLPAHRPTADGCCQVVAWVRSFIKPDLFDNNVPFDNTTPIYLINPLWKLELGLGLDLELHYCRIFRGE